MAFSSSAGWYADRSQTRRLLCRPWAPRTPALRGFARCALGGTVSGPAPGLHRPPGAPRPGVGGDRLEDQPARPLIAGLRRIRVVALRHGGSLSPPDAPL